MDFGALLSHIATTNYQFCAGLKDADGLPCLHRQRRTPWQVLGDSFDYCSAVISGISEEQLGKVHNSPMEGSGPEILLAMYIHVAHHRGQAEIYLRDKGIKPPATGLKPTRATRDSTFLPPFGRALPGSVSVLGAAKAGIGGTSRVRLLIGKDRRIAAPLRTNGSIHWWLHRRASWPDTPMLDTPPKHRTASQRYLAGTQGTLDRPGEDYGCDAAPVTGVVREFQLALWASAICVIEPGHPVPEPLWCRRA